MSKVSLTNLVNLQNETTAVNAINANNAALTTAFDNTLSRDGTSPNVMNASLDMNSNHILNLPAPVNQSEPLRLADVTQITQFQNSVNLAVAVTSASTSATNAATSATNAATSATNAATSAATAASVVSTNLTASTRIARLGTTGNITLSGFFAIDGITPIAGDRILVKNQTTASQNGLYVAAAGAWARATDFNAVPPVQNGAVISVLQGNTLTGTSWILSCPDNVITLDTSLLTFTQSTTLNGDVTTYAFQQDGANTVPLSIVKILKQWYTLQMYGGGPEKTSAQNAAAFAAARDGLLLKGGTLTVTPGTYACDPVNFVRSDVINGSMKIQGTSNPSGPANNNAVILPNISGSGIFWNFDSPSAGISNGSNWTVDSLYFYHSNPTFSGTLISSSTPVTTGLKISNNFILRNCVLAQAGPASSCTLLDIGKTIITSVHGNVFGGGACQVKGQQGLTVAGIAQARQSTTVDLRKNTFQGCNGYAILYGGEGWGCYDNAFEGDATGRLRCFSTTSNYPIRNMTWINNWCGDTQSNPGDQAFLFYGQGLVFMGNYVGGGWTGSGPGFNAIFMDGVKGFNISGNSFDNCSAAITSGGAATAPNYGSIEGNVLNMGAISSGSFGAGVRITGNGI